MDANYELLYDLNVEIMNVITWLKPLVMDYNRNSIC